MEADLKLKLQQLHQRVDVLKDQINTEEATKKRFCYAIYTNLRIRYI